MELHIYKDPEELSRALAEWITADIEKCLQTKGRYCWALTGGGSPKRLYELLASAPLRQRIEWKKLHIFWGDERAVPFDDDRNNAKMTYEHLLQSVPVPRNQVHIMRTDIDPQQSAVEYEEILHQYFDGSEASFDLVLSGMGEDGHTLSLFPGTEVIHEPVKWVCAFYLPAQSMYRITLTAGIVNRSKKVAFLTFGPGKAAALHAVLQGDRNIDKYPSQIIQPASGELHWFVDESAASQLD